MVRVLMMRAKWKEWMRSRQCQRRVLEKVEMTDAGNLLEVMSGWMMVCALVMGAE